MKKRTITACFLGIFLASCGPVTPYPGSTFEDETYPELEVITSKNINNIEEIATWGKGYISGADISPDGKQLAVYTPTGMYFYDTGSFQETKLETPQEIPFRKWRNPGAVQYRPDGKILAFGVQNIHFWNFTENKFESNLINHFPDAQVTGINYSPDGNYIMLQSYVGLSSLCEGVGINLALYNTKNNQLLFDVPYCRTEGARYIFTENDKVYIFLSVTSFVPVPYKVLVIKTSTGELLEEITYPFDDMQSMRLYNVSVDDKNLASINFYGNSHTTQVVNRSASISPVELMDQSIYYTPNKKRRWVHKGTYEDFQYSRGKFELQDNTGRVLCSFEGTTPLSMNFSDDGEKMVTASFPSQIQLWDISTCSLAKSLDFLSPDAGLFFSPNGMYLSATNPWTIYVWDAKSGNYKYTVPVHSFLGGGPPFDFSYNSSSLITLREGEDPNDYKFAEIDLQSGKDIRVFGRGDFWIRSIVNSSGQTFSTITQYAHLGYFEIWDSNKNEIISKFSGENVKASYDSAKTKAVLLLDGVANNIVVVDLITGAVLSEFNIPKASLVKYLPGDKLLIGMFDNDSEKWSLVRTDLKGSVQRSLRKNSDICTSRNFTVASRYLVFICDDNHIQLMDIDFNEINTMLGHRRINKTDYQATNAIFSPKEDFLASLTVIEDYSSRYSASEIRFWNISNGLLINEIQVNYVIADLKFSPDGRMLAYLSEDGTIHILGVPNNGVQEQ